MTRLVEVISPQPMPLMASIDLRCRDIYVIFRQQLFPSGVPRLTTASIKDAHIFSIHFCLPAFQCLTSLRLHGLDIITQYNDQWYRSLRDVLMALPSLRHLDLLILRFIARSSRLPILLPAIHYLHVEGCPEDVPDHYLGHLLRCIQAPYLVALSLSTWNAEEPLQIFALPYERHFPTLQHLILKDITYDAPHLMTFSRAFPCIERLTFKSGSHPSALLQDINQILGIILSGDNDRAENSAHGGLLWPKLCSIAFSTSREHLDDPRLKNTILKLQAAGHPIRKLMLPQEVHSAMVETRGSAELEDFYVDWPTPFDW